MLDLRAKDLMNSEVKTVEETWSVSEVSEFLISNMISGAPVLSEDSKIVGVISLTDIAKFQIGKVGSISRDNEQSGFFIQHFELPADEQDLDGFHLQVEETRLVRDVMTPVVFQVDENATIGEIADMMLGGRIHRLIVTSGKALAGIITTSDMLKVVRDFAHANQP